MSNNKPKFSINIDVPNKINAKSAPRLIIDTDHPNSNLNVRSLDAKVYFMRNCGKSIDLKNLKFINYISINGSITKNCIKYVIDNPEIVSKDSTYIRINSKNRRRINGIFENYLNKDTLKEYKDSFRETPIVSGDYVPLHHKGAFRVFTIYNYDIVDGNVLYIIMYDPYHLIFSNNDTYSSRTDNLGRDVTSIEDQFHSSVDKERIRSFSSLV